MASIEIRSVEKHDMPLWKPLWEGYQEFYGIRIPEPVTDATWRRFLDPGQPMNAALAWDGDEAVGMVHWIFHRSCWTEGDYCYLQDLFVSPRARGRSAGRGLIEHVYGQARKAGCARVYWLTHESNLPAMMLYDRVAEKSGFTQYRKIL